MFTIGATGNFACLLLAFTKCGKWSSIMVDPVFMIPFEIKAKASIYEYREFVV
jgi:hypothetical protein